MTTYQSDFLFREHTNTIAKNTKNYNKYTSKFINGFFNDLLIFTLLISRTHKKLSRKHKYISSIIIHQCFQWNLFFSPEYKITFLSTQIHVENIQIYFLNDHLSVRLSNTRIHKYISEIFKKKSFQEYRNTFLENTSIFPEYTNTFP